MILASCGAASRRARAFQTLLVCLFLSLFSFFIITPAGAVTVRTCGPFDVTFYGLNETYTQDGTVYTGTKNWTAAEMDDVAAMINIWDGAIANAAGPRQVKLNMMWNASSTYLGYSLNGFAGDGTTAQTYAERLWRSGTTIDNPSADAFIVFSSSMSWNTGAGAPAWNKYDFRSVVAHELGHTLGVISTYDGASDTWWNGGLTEWDKQLRDASLGGNAPVAGGAGAPGNFNETANPAYFNGANAKAANGGNRVAVYAPSTYNSGSSLAHLDESTFPSALMSVSIANGQMQRQPTALEWQIMKDLGWTLDTTDKTWTNGAGNLQWGNADNWNITGVPDAASPVLFSGAYISSGDSIDLGGDRSVLNLTIDSAQGFTVDGAAGTLTIASGSITRTAASAGTQTIARPIALGANAVWDIAGAGSLNVSGGISGNFTLQKQGTGTLNLSGANTYAGPTNVTSGTLIVSGGSNPAAGFNISSGATLTFTGGSYNMSGVGVTNAGTINFNGGSENISAATITSSGTVNITNGIVAADLATTVPGTVIMSGGNLTGTAMITFTSPLSWTGGSMTGSGATRLQLGMNVSGAGTLLLGQRTLLNVANAVFTANSLHGKDGAVFNNQSGALVDLQATNNFINDGVGAAPSITNAGTFRKSTSTSTIDIGFAMNNTGMVDVQKGTMNLSGGGTSAGSFNVASGATLGFTGGTHYLGGATFTNAGTINIAVATATFNSFASIPGTVNFSSGTLNGTATMSFTGPVTWTGGTMSGSGATLTQGGITLSGSGDTYLDGRTLQIVGTATFTGSNYLHGRNGGTFYNSNPSWIVDLQGTNNFVNDGGATPVISNYGTFRKSTSASTINVGFAMNNYGSVQVQTGTLNLAGGGTGSGSFSVSAGATLGFTGGTFNLGGNIFDNANIININGATLTSDSGAITIPGTVNFTSGTLTGGSGPLTFSGALTWTGGTISGASSSQLTVIGSSLNLSGIGNTYLDNRTLRNYGTATFTSSNYLYGSNGAILSNQSNALLDIQGTNRLAFGSGATPAIENLGTVRKSVSTGLLDVYWAMNNSGTVDVQKGTLNLRAGGSGGGTYNVAAGATLAFNGGTYSILGTSTFTNAGSLNFIAGNVNVGPATFTNSGTINFSGATAGFNNAVTIPGTVNINGGTVNFNSFPFSSTVSGTATFSSGTLGGTGGVDFQNLSWTGGSMANTAGVNIPTRGAASIVGNGQAFSLNGGSPVFINNGNTTLTGTTLYSATGTASTINNLPSGTFDIQSNLNLSLSGSGAGTINNSGTFNKTGGAGTSTIAWTMNNTGTVQVAAGTLTFQNAVTQLPGSTLTGGTWIVYANSALNIATGGNIITNQGAVTLAGVGSTFAKINTITSNQGSFSVIVGRNFTTVADLANSGSLTVGTGSSFVVSGNLTGNGSTTVNGAMTANAIFQNTLTVGAGATVTINPFPGGPLGSQSLAPVPEPSTLVMLLFAAAGVVWYRASRRR
jgi:autotransporter-associated beta strand protein